MQDSNLLLYINGSIVFVKNRQKWNWSLVPKIVLVAAFAFETTFLSLINITKSVYQDLQLYKHSILCWSNYIT